MTRPLLALSNVIIDRVREADGREHPPMPGGAGLYAAIAMRMWWPKVALVAGVGADLGAATGNAMARYDLDPRGPVVRDARSIVSQLTYFADGSRSEVAIFGADHFERMQVDPSDIDPALLPAAGTYVFRGADPSFWSGIAQRRCELGVILWEVDGGFAQAGDVTVFAALCRQVDAVSLNLAEAYDLFGAMPVHSLLRRLNEMGPAVVLLRMGAEGALIFARDTDVLHIHPPSYPVVDVTGGGNAFTGGFLAGLCRRPGDLAAAGRCAAAAAACMIAQRGPPSAIDNDALAALAATTRVTPFSATMKV